MFFFQRQPKTPLMSMEEGVKRRQQDASIWLIDVRTPSEYAQGHLPRSVNIPLQQLTITKKLPAADTEMLVYCHSGARSRRAAAALRKLGYTNVHDLGGLMHWPHALTH